MHQWRHLTKTLEVTWRDGMDGIEPLGKGNETHQRRHLTETLVVIWRGRDDRGWNHKEDATRPINGVISPRPSVTIDVMSNSGDISFRPRVCPPILSAGLGNSTLWPWP